MKYEYIKGTEEDFTGAPEWATHQVKYGEVIYFVEDFDYMAKAIRVNDLSEIRISNPALFTIIAQRKKAKTENATPHLAAALKTLKHLGYTYTGGEQWRPPHGEKPDYIKWEQGELDGLPPVNTECLVKQANSKFSVFSGWSVCKIIAYNNGSTGLQIVIKDNNGDVAILYPDDDTTEFKPNPTEEQIRETQINEIASLIGRGSFFEDAENIYEAISSGKIIIPVKSS